MLERTDKERLASLEADIPWIKESLGRLESGLKDLHELFEDHLIHHRSSSGTNGNGSNGGVQIIIGKRALGVLATVPIGGTLAGIAAYLKFLGVLG